MRDYKWIKGLVVMALCGLGGGVLGAGMQIILRVSEPTAIKAAFNQFAPNLFWIALGCGVVGIMGYFYFNSLFKKDGYSNEEGSLFDRNENKMSIVMTFSTVCAILNFTAFGVNLLNDLTSIHFMLFMGNVVLAFMGEVANISLAKKVRPELNADPVSPGFRKDYFDKLDECEKIEVGKASFKTMSGMVAVYVTVFVICFLLIMTLEVSPIICLPVGILWFIQTVIMIYHSYKKK
ncbi:MAG: DUF3169 family protein [Cellulosilyticaceae bacterium]